MTVMSKDAVISAGCCLAVVTFLSLLSPLSYFLLKKFPLNNESISFIGQSPGHLSIIFSFLNTLL